MQAEVIRFFRGYYFKLPKFEYFVVLFSLTGIMAYVPFPYLLQLFIRAICYFTYLFFIIRYIRSIKEKEQKFVIDDPFFLILVLLFIIVGSVAHIRSSYSNKVDTEQVFWNWIHWFLFTIFFIVTYIKKRKFNERKKFREAILYSILLYVSINSLFQILGFSPPYVFAKHYPALMLRSLGIESQRILFPTSIGFTSTGIMGGASLIIGTIMLQNEPHLRSKIFALIGVLSGLYLLLMTDSRGALLFTILTIIFLLFPFSKSFFFLRWLPLIVPTLPILLIFLIGLLPNSILSMFTRSTLAEGTNSFLSNRIIIWDAFLNYLTNFQPLLLIGHGYIGQLISGVSKSYSFFFSSWDFPDSTTAHNFTLQTIIETGYLGLLLVLSLILKMLNKFGLYRLQNHDIFAKSIFFVMIFFLIMGSTESVLTLGHLETLYVFMMFMALSLSEDFNSYSAIDVEISSI